MKKIKYLLCKIGFHKWRYEVGSLDLITRHGFEWRNCKWCGKEHKIEF